MSDHASDTSPVKPPPLDALIPRLGAFIDRPRDEDFTALALAAFAAQYAGLEPYRRLCDARGRQPGMVHRWQDIPLLPIAAFKSFDLHIAPPRETFRSSGTTRVNRSVHYHPFPDLYRRTIERTFPQFCLPAPAPVPILSLILSRQQARDSSLGFMADHVLKRFGDSTSQTAFGPHGVEVEQATRWCQALDPNRPALILATAFALVQWLDALAEKGLILRLPPGTHLFETGGFKGKVREVDRGELEDLIARHLGVSPSGMVREYGMTELTGQFYTRARQGGDPNLFIAPPFMRVRCLEPETLEPLGPGRPGLIAIFDLSNIGSAVHILTEDLGQLDGDGFRLLGRASDAELRGCSLSVEELAFPSLPESPKR